MEFYVAAKIVAREILKCHILNSLTIELSKRNMQCPCENNCK